MKQINLLYTGNQQCFGVRYSPFDSNYLACVACEKFGMGGGASLLIIKNEERAFLDSKFSVVESFRSSVTLYDVEWSPLDKSLLLTANADGSVAIWLYDSAIRVNQSKPIFQSWRHKKETYAIQWEPSGMRSYHFLSASFDKTIKIWNFSSSGLTDLTSLSGHESQIYSASWNPKVSGIILSTSADKTFRIWDVNNITNMPVFVSAKCSADVLCCDWSKHDTNICAIGYSSGLIEIRDFRNMSKPTCKSLDAAHKYAVKRVRFSPHHPGLLASASYDMCTKLWKIDGSASGLVEEGRNHSEFAYGLDFDPKVDNRLVDCGWDKRVVISEFELPQRFY